MQVDLSKFDNSWYDPGRGLAVRLLWQVTNALFLQNPLNPSSWLKVSLLRLFGARIGRGVVLKPGISVKYPWNLEIGAHSWIGENAWLDSLAPIKIADNACISQGVYLCTGNHDWSDPAFGLVLKPISVAAGAWVGARATLLPGVTVSEGSVVVAGAVLAKDTQPFMIYAGVPAVMVKRRTLRAEGTL
jgi:putative colanic acid biosynthesis acetyltransferase WcaF